MSKQLALSAIASTLLARRATAQCAVSGEIAKFTGECTLENFQNALTGCTIEELFEDPAAEIADLCKYEAPVQFVEINGVYQLDRRYMDGGGPLIDGPEQFSIEAARILRFDANLGHNTLIEWPEYAALVEYNANQGLGDHGYSPNFDLENSCDLNTVMCCFIDDVQDAGFGAGGTTDVCRHDLANSPKSNHIQNGWSIFPNEETSTHCVGFTWEDGTASDIFKGNALFDISLRNTASKGYSKSIPGAPLCACIEHMPIVEKADCRTATGGDIEFTFIHDAATGEISGSNSVLVEYKDCDDKDLATTFKNIHKDRADDIDAHLVGEGNCEDSIMDYLNEEQFIVPGTHATKYLDINDSNGWTFVVGEGIRFLPPGIDSEKSDTDFRALINGGCTDKESGETRACLIRRFCDSCTSDIHRDIYYKRITPIPEFGEGEGQVYFLDLFMNNWFSTPANELHIDFELYSTYEDALAGSNPWQYCNYNDPGIGFPRDCNKDSWGYGNQWNSYVRSGADANHHGFYVEKPGV